MGGRGMVERIAARYPERAARRRAGPACRRVVRAGAAPAPRPRLPSLPRFRAMRRRVHLRKRVHDRAPRIVVASRRIERWARGSAVRPGSIACCRFLERGIPGARPLESFLAARGPRRAAHHAARGPRLAAARSLCRGAAAWRSDGAAGRELGSPVEQVAAARDARSRHSLERHAAREATELHGVPADRVVVTGAQCYDQWFDRAPARRLCRRSASASVCVRIARSCCMSARRSSGARRSSRRSPSAGFKRSAAAPILA